MAWFGAGPARSWTIGGIAAAIVVSGVGYAWAVHQPNARPHAVAPTATSAPTSPGPTGTASASASASATPLPSIGTPPPGPGLAVTIQLQRDGGVVISERLTWTPAAPSAALVMSLPLRIDGPGVPAGKFATPHLTGLQATYDADVVVPQPGGTATGRTWSIVGPTSRPGQHVVELRYRVDGVAVPSTPGPPGRATVVVAPLLVSAAAAGRLPVWLTVIGPAGGTVRGVNCPLAAPARVVCGDRRAGAWLIERSGAGTSDLRRVTLQADLPGG